MTISDTTAKKSYSGNGNSTGFAIPFKFFGTTTDLFPDVVVNIRTISTGVETLQTYTTHYTITGGGATTPAVGTLTMGTAPTTDEELHISRSTSLDQNVVFTAGASFPSTSHENSLDKNVMQSIDQQDDIDRSIKFPRTDPDSISTELPNSVDRALGYLSFDADGKMTAGGVPSSTTASATMAAVLASTDEGSARTLLEIEDANSLTNPCGEVSQRLGTTPYTAATSYNNNDGAYTVDGWKILSDGNDAIDVSSQTTGGPTGLASHFIRCEVASDKKFGMFQVVENRLTRQIAQSGGAEISFYYRMGNGDSFDIDFYLLKTTSGADAPTADPISAWNAGDGPVTLTGWTSVIEKNAITPTTTWQKYSANVPSGVSNALNLGFFLGEINNDQTKTVGDMFDFTLPVLVPLNGSTFSRQPTFEQELRRSQRTFIKTFAYGTAPAEGVATGALRTMGSAATATDPMFVFDYRFPVPMVLAPVAAEFTYFNPVAAGTDARAENLTDSSDIVVDAEDMSEASARIGAVTPVNTDQNDEMTVHCTVDLAL